MLSIRGLTRRAGDGPAIGPLDLEVPAGRLVALMGASGSGKSLLLRAIADLDPAAGRVSLDGVDREAVDAPAWRRQVIYVAAQAGWWDDRVGAHFADPDAGGTVLPRLGLEAAALDWPVDRLSSGERQRLALARAVTLPRPAGAARAYLLDEPTAALDADSAARVEALISGLADARTAVLLVTHDAAQAARLGSGGVVHLRGGRLEA
ncbi:ATP-binding cassette domain-containing protein [Novispirillum sp. DQ9]|uniref:ABC transporter ATP-binding protein n=1 Tax=Novispirillum sp. DQ9 TaxID=3398612 RepID=UPI003C7A34E3